MSKGILQVHPPICDCPGCRISSPVNRGRLADKRTVTLPPTHALKKERTTSFSASDGDSDGTGPACRQQPGLKQEDDPHVHIMKRRIHTHWDVNISFRETSCSQDNNLPTLISSVHRSHHLVMPEHPSHCDFQRGNVEIGLGPAGDLLGKRLGCSSYITSDCSSEKKVRSKSPQETLLLPELESTMAPEDHYHRLMSALSEAGPFEETQRLYQLGIPSHDLIRVRQEVATATLRSPSSLEVHLPSSTAGRRKQGLFQHREGTVPAATPSFSERELSQPPPLLSPQNAPHIALGSHLRPPFFGVPTALCQTPGTMGGLFTDETTAPEDVNKWTVEDVCNFVGGLSGCGEYARVFREQGIDGETLPLLTEEHLLNTMGLKLGPALKIRAQVAKRLGRVFYMASFPVALPLQPPNLQAPELSPGQQLLSPATTTSPYEGAHLPTGRASPKQENGSGTTALLPGASDPSQLL